MCHWKRYFSNFAKFGKIFRLISYCFNPDYIQASLRLRYSNNTLNDGQRNVRELFEHNKELIDTQLKHCVSCR